MGENEEKIVYSPAEQQEIERILSYISQETLGYLAADQMPSSADIGIKKSVNLPEEDLSMTDVEDTLTQQKYEDFPEEMDIQELAEPVEEEQEEIQDITNLIQEIKEKPEDEIQEEISEEDLLKDVSFTEESEEETPPSIKEKPSAEEEFPETLDLEKETEIKDTGEQPEFDISLLDEELEKQQDEFSPVETIKVPQVESAEEIEELKEPLSDEESLKEFELESADIGTEEFKPEIASEKKSAEADILDMDMAEISPTEEIYPKAKDEKPATQVESEFPSFDELEDLQEIPSKADEKPKAKAKPSREIPEEDLAADLEELGKLEEEETPRAIKQDLRLGEPLEDEIPVSKGRVEETATDEIDLSDKELKKLNKAIQLFHPNMIKIIKDVIVNDLLSAPDIRKLVDMLLSGKQEDQIKSFLEKKLNKKIDTSVKPGIRRRVLAARPEYTKEGRERQKRLLKFTGIFGASALVVFIITIVAYQYAYIPYMAKRNIDEGVALIKKPGVSAAQKQDDYKKAEQLFSHVNENYIKDYLYGYHSYARAYFQNKDYDYSLEKLNKAYDINAADVDTLNNLGFFYAKVPEAKFEQIKPELQKYYYKKIKPVGPINKPVDVAIDFYRKALNLDPKNITALYGIGNAYTFRGEYTKAKQYYEDILSVDKESIIGYSGLINLYIERDAFPEVVTIHSTLGNRKKLSQLPSALLAKIASYYLSKKRTDDKNIRIDHGIDSSAIKDVNDNPFPAVKNVLDALAVRDIDYPPLFVQFAKLSREEKNYTLMKRNLLTALEKDPNYFAAHVLLAEYYYFLKDFVEAYKSSKKALQAYLTPPEFTNDDFYYETEKIGSAYAIMGNIFYYSDKVKFRFGDELAEESSPEKSDQMANYGIAQEKYEKALAENYKSSEVFYNLGRIYYVKGQYDKATTTWLNLYEDFTAQPELLLALGNAFYHQNNLEASKGEFLKVISIFESKTDNLVQILPARAEHVKYYQTLSSAYNNLGAVYQIQNNESKSNISYWKAIDYAKRIERENEFARYNLARAFKPGRQNILPVLDENIADSIDMYKELK